MGRIPTFALALKTATTKASFHNHGRADLHIFEKLFGHVVGHSNTAVGSGVAWEVAGVHADGVVEAHEVGHGGVVEDLAGADFIDADIGVVVDDLAGGFVFDDSVKR